MAANVETMFYSREKPWHGLGKCVKEALSSEEALIQAGLNWNVIQKPIYTDEDIPISGYKANIRDIDQKVLGVVTDRYKVVQNRDAFSFTDKLLGNGVKYETAGSLQGGRRIWILAKLPTDYIITGERILPYLVFSNCHDGSGAIKVAMTPIRVVCQNTLNLAIRDAKRSWTAIHTGNIANKLEEAQETLFMADKYMKGLAGGIEELQQIHLMDEEVLEFVDILLPVDDEASKKQKQNVEKLREDLKKRYFHAPDLSNVGKNGYRFVNAVSDFATHAKPLRETSNFKENLFARTIDGNPLIDKSYQLVKMVA